MIEENNNALRFHLRLIGFFILLVGIMFWPISVQAAPAAPTEVTLSQPDGVKFQARSWGDEWLNGMETVEGYTILQDPQTGSWVYAQPTLDQRLAPSLQNDAPLVVGQDKPIGLAKHLRPKSEIGISSINGLSLPDRSLSMAPTSNGEHNLLVLLVEFQNIPGRTNPDDWSTKIFGQTDSLWHYYYDASFGNLNLLPAAESFGTPMDGVVGWITLSYNHPNTAGSLSSDNLQITRDAIIAADPYVNFALFDSDNDGYLSYEELHVMVIVAGHEGAYGGADTCAPSVWAHQYYLDFAYVNAPVVDGVKVASYQAGGYTQFGEIHCEPENAPGHPATIGIIAHEFGHDLNWPDLYDTTFATRGIGDWGLMATGMWNRSDPSSAVYGDKPAYPTAWSRWYQGWVNPTQINKSMLNVNIPPVATSGVIYQLRDNPNGIDWIWNQKSGVGQYFLVENRQPIGYDVGLPGFGLLIWHIDESVILNNFANSDPNHRLVDLVQADGLRQLNTTYTDGDAGDPYPGTTINTVFNDTSNPNSQLYGGIPSGVSLKDISLGTAPNFMANVFVSSFTDVSPNEWYWSPIESLVAAQVTQGYGQGLYKPQAETTRGEFAVLLGRAIYGWDAALSPATGEIFEDVDAGYWAAIWIEKLYQDGLTKGCKAEPLRFCPEENVSRDEMAVFLIRYLYGNDYSLAPPNGIFKDVAINTHWAAAEIEQLYLDGITKGCSISPLNYCPNRAVLRSEVAAFLARAFNFVTP